MLLDSSIEQRLGMHDESLRSHRERFEAHKKWLQGQRATPSFTTAGADEILQQLDNNVKENSHLRTNYGASHSRGADTIPASKHRSSSSSNSSRGRSTSVYDGLIEKGKLYEQNREKLREEAVLREMAHVRSKPQVSEMARQLKRDDRIEDRFVRIEQERRQLAEWNHQRALKKEEEEQSHPFRPQISKRGQRATSRTKTSKDNGALWQQKREEQMESMRMKRIIAEMAEVRGIPEIDERSAKLAERKMEKMGLQGYSHLDTLLERDRLARMAAWERQQIELRSAQPGSPRITAFAATLPREGDVFDRLYQNSVDAEARQTHMIRSRQAEQETNYPFTPRITQNANTLIRDKPVEQDLLERHAQARAMQEEHIRLMMERERNLHVPAINPVSDEIAARLPETSKERLFKPKTRHGDPKDTECTFRPNLAPNSSGLLQESGTSSIGSHELHGTRSTQGGASGGVSSRDRIEQLYHREMQRQERLDQLRAAEIQRQMNECTFQPATRGSSSVGGYNGGGGTMENYGGVGGQQAPLQVYHRVTQWARRRDQKLQEQRMERERQELASCTFRPVNVGTIEQHVQNLSMNPNTNNTIYGGDGRAWGFDEYIERQRIARKRQEEKEEKMRSCGENWKNTITVPQEFQLGRRDKPIKSLQKPIEAPIHPPRRDGPADMLNYSSEGPQFYHDPNRMGSGYRNDSTTSATGDDIMGGSSYTADGWQRGNGSGTSLPPPGTFSTRAPTTIPVS